MGFKESADLDSLRILTVQPWAPLNSCRLIFFSCRILIRVFFSLVCCEHHTKFTYLKVFYEHQSAVPSGGYQPHFARCLYNRLGLLETGEMLGGREVLWANHMKRILSPLRLWVYYQQRTLWITCCCLQGNLIIVLFWEIHFPLFWFYSFG